MFHDAKFIITQFEKGARKETSEVNKQTMMLDYLRTFASATTLGFYPFDSSRNELNHAL